MPPPDLDATRFLQHAVRRGRDPDYQIRLRSDCVCVRNWINHRRRFYSLETPEMRERYGHLVASYDEWR
jgi:hypothetical protein